MTISQDEKVGFKFQPIDIIQREDKSQSIFPVDIDYNNNFRGIVEGIIQNDKTDQKVQALKEGRLVWNPLKASVTPGVPKVVRDWKEYLHSTDKSPAEIKKKLDGYIEVIKKDPLYKDKTEEEFKRDVYLPLLDATFEDKRFRYDGDDADVKVHERILWAIDRALPTGAVENVKKLLLSMPAPMFAPPQYEEQRQKDLQKLEEETKKSGDISKAYEVVRDTLGKERLDYPWWSFRKIIEFDIPDLTNTTLNFLLLRKSASALIGTKLAANLGIPKALDTIKQTSPIVHRAAQSASLLGANTAIADLEGFKERPKERMVETLKSTLMGAGFGTVSSIFPNPITQLGVTSGAVWTEAFVSAKSGGADSREAAMQAMEVMKSQIALQLSSGISNKLAAAKARAKANQALVEKIKVEYPKMSTRQAKLHAKIALTTFTEQQTGLIYKRMLKPFEAANKHNELLPHERKKYDEFKGRLEQIRIQSQREKLHAQDILAKSKFESSERKAALAKVVSSAEAIKEKARLINKVDRRVKELNLSNNVVKAQFKTIIGSDVLTDLSKLSIAELNQFLNNINRFSTELVVKQKEMEFGLSTKESNQIKSLAKTPDAYALTLSNYP